MYVDSHPLADPRPRLGSARYIIFVSRCFVVFFPGIPYGTVNLNRGVPDGETTVSSLAGAGSLSVEFSVLSALTGDGVFSEV